MVDITPRSEGSSGRTLAASFLVFALGGCGRPASPPAAVRASAPVVVPADDYVHEAEARLRALDVDGAEALLEGRPSTAPERVLRQRIAMARLDFDAAWRLDDPSSPESQRLAWMIAWYRDDMATWARLFPKRPRGATSTLEMALASMPLDTRPTRRHEVTSGSARTVSLVARSPLGPLPVGIPCKVGGVDTTATIDLHVPITYVDSRLTGATAWAELVFAGTGGKALAVTTLVVPNGRVKLFAGVVVGADLARFLNFSFDTNTSKATFSLEAPARPPTPEVSPLFWPLGQYPATVIKLLSPIDEFEETAATFGLFGPVVVDANWTTEKIPWRIDRARVGAVDLPVGGDPPVLLSHSEIDLHAAIGWNAFAGHRVTLGAGGRELWIE